MLLVFVFDFSGWWEVVVIVIVLLEWRRIVERGRGCADNDDGCSSDYFSLTMAMTLVAL